MKRSRSLPGFVSFLYWLTLVCPLASEADLGLPTMQAVCRISLKSGENIEGLIVVGTGFDDSHIDTNGFYILLEHRHGKVEFVRPFIFNHAQWKISFKETPGENWMGLNAQIKKVYFLRDVTSRNYFNNEKKMVEDKHHEVVEGEKVLKLKRTIMQHSEYELLDFISIYLEVPQELYLESVAKIKPKTIRIENVVEFQLLKDPGKRWLEKIAEAKDKFWKLNAADETGDIQAPDWFHEIVKSLGEYKGFKPWRE